MSSRNFLSHLCGLDFILSLAPLQAGVTSPQLLLHGYLPMAGPPRVLPSLFFTQIPPSLQGTGLENRGSGS